MPTTSPFFNIYIPPATTGTAKNLTTTLICCLEYLTRFEDANIKYYLNNSEMIKAVKKGEIDNLQVYENWVKLFRIFIK